MSISIPLEATVSSGVLSFTGYGSWNPAIPDNCVSWMDGCNDCSMMSGGPDGDMMACTEMYCTNFNCLPHC